MGHTRAERSEADRKFFVGLSRAFGGAVFFSLPLLMTMEMWYLGFYLDRTRVLLFILFILPVLVVLDRFSGFMPASTWFEDAVDGVIAFGVGAVAASAILASLGILAPGMPAQEIAGKIALQAVPGAFGAVLAHSQFDADRGDAAADSVRRRHPYLAQLFFMLVGSVFLAFNIAPTEEVVLIGAHIGPVRALLLVLLTLGLMHAFVYGSRFRGSPELEGTSGWSVFLRYTLVGYALAVLVCAYVLWTFGRLTGGGGTESVVQVIVLSLPAGLGAAAARLIL